MSESFVEEHFGCPNCGERRVDYLEIDEDNNVHCCSCDFNYEI